MKGKTLSGELNGMGRYKGKGMNRQDGEERRKCVIQNEKGGIVEAGEGGERGMKIGN